MSSLIAELVNLRILLLQGNKFKELPLGICKIISLEELNLYDNEITLLP
jgi:Leucine-rich repeat (LRR) protein